MHPQPPRRTTHAYGTPRNLLVHDRWGRFGRPVVLLHGLGYDRTMWWPVAAELGDTCAAVAVDLPGHGDSAPRENCDLGELAHDLVMLISRLDLRRAPVLVGHAESALLATTFAERYATHTVITVDEDCPDRDTCLDEIPEGYRQFAVARRDPALLDAYRGWDVPPARVRIGTAASVPFEGRRLPHLRDPARFADLLRVLR